MLSANRPDRQGFNDSRVLAPTYTRHPRTGYVCWRYGAALSRRETPESLQMFRPRKGAGDPRVRARPDPRGRAWRMPGARCTRGPCAKGKKHTVVTTVAPEHPAFPHAMVLTAYAVISPATNSSCHRHRRIDGSAEPGRARNTSADLTPATGARTTRFCRPQPPAPKLSTGLVPVRRNLSRRRIQHRSSARRLRLTGLRSALPAHCAPDAAASTASHPNVRDDGQRPLCRMRRRGL
jgi:hypothetical protein